MTQPWPDRQGEYPPPRPQSGPVPWPGGPSSAVQPFATRPDGAGPYSAQPTAIYPTADPYAVAQPYAGHASPAAGGTLVPVGERFGAFLLDALLCLVTLGFGYLVWSLVTWSDGQTPAKRLLGHVVVDAQTGIPFDWGRMALRQFVIQGLLGGLLTSLSLGIYFWVDALMVFGEQPRTLHDRMANSVVRHV